MVAADEHVAHSHRLARDVRRGLGREGVGDLVPDHDLPGAGVGAEQVARAGSRMRPPILYLEGTPHRVQRKAAARFFAPKVTEDYRAMMSDLSAELVGRLRTDCATDLSQLSLTMAVQVAARVIGLTNSSLEGMTRRLDSFFAFDAGVDRITDLSEPLQPFFGQPFMTGMDVYVPVGRPVTVTVRPRGGNGEVDTLTVPGLPSSGHRMSLQFDDHLG